MGQRSGQYLIEKNIPIPDWPPGHKAEAPLYGGKYPFQKLDVMESFFVPNRIGETVQQTARRVFPRVSRESREKKKFVGRKCMDGVRIWRVK